MSWPVGTILKIAANIVLNDEQEAINVFWTLLGDNVGSGPLEDSDILAAAGNYIDALYDNIKIDISDTVWAGIVEVWAVDPVDGDQTPIGDDLAIWVGGNVGDAFPNGVAAICSMKTEDTDVTGRKFLPGYTEAAFTDNNMDATSLARLILFAADWASDYVDPNDVVLEPGIWSQTKLDFVAATGITVVNTIAGYQRRRKPGVGS